MFISCFESYNIADLTTSDWVTPYGLKAALGQSTSTQEDLECELKTAKSESSRANAQLELTANKLNDLDRDLHAARAEMSVL